MTTEQPELTPLKAMGAALRAHRLRAGVSGVELARRAGYSQSAISRMERGEIIPSILAAGRIAWALRLPRAIRRDLIDQARRLQEERAGMVPIRTVLQFGPESIQRRIRLQERGVHRQRLFHPAMLPGLLQTEGYMRLVAAGGDLTDPARLDRFLLERSHRRREAATRECTFIIPEGCLYQGIPDPAVMAEQCEHLARLAVEHQYWKLGVIPRITTPGSRPNMTMNGFDIYDERQVFLGTTGGNALSLDEDTVRRHSSQFSRLAEIAVWGEEAAILLRRIARDFSPEDVS